jgi:hypothetical protein
MKVRLVVLALAVVTGIALSASAQEKPITLQPHQAELNFSALWQEGDWGNGVVLSGRFGYLLDEHHEVGPLGSFIYSRPNAGATYHGGTAGLFYRYNLSPYGRFVIPFVDLSNQWGFGDQRQTTRYIEEIEAGVRLMLSKSAAVNVAMVYERDRVTFGLPLVQRTFALVTGISIFTGPLFQRAASSSSR